MDTIQIKNLRLLKDTGPIKIKPLTVLLGSNGSGKSTFLRTFPLLKQSIEQRTSSPILWYGGEKGYVDFGSFKEAVHNFDVNKNITLNFVSSITYYRPFPTHDSNRRMSRSYSKNTILVEFGVEIKNAKEKVFIDSFSLVFDGHTIIIKFNNEGEVIGFLVNKNDFTKDLQNLQMEGIIPNVVRKTESQFFIRGTSDLAINFLNRLKEKIKAQIIDEGINEILTDEDVSRIINRVYKPENTLEEILKNLSHKDDPRRWVDNVSLWTNDDPIYQEIRDLFVAHSFFFLLDEVSQYFSTFCQNINYIKPVRATAERYYRYRDFAIREVAANGENLDMFIKGLQDEKDNRLELFQKWTKKHFGFFVLIHLSEGHVSLKIQEKNSEQTINLADTGFGFSQILPIITQLWWLLYKNNKQNKHNRRDTTHPPIIFAIEQPELHLHPKLQALLADAFIAAVDEAEQKNINLKLIIETHSETIINRLGRRIANGNLNHDAINVVIFERETNQKSATVQIAKYDQEGFLDDWPIGFFEPDIIKNS